MTTFIHAAPSCRSGGRRVRQMTADGPEQPRARARRSRRALRADRGPFGGRRARRGDIRTAILALLAEQPMHGYQIIQELSERTGGVWTPSPGSVYPTLQQLEDEELVRATESDTGKRVYELTDAGRERAAGQPEPWKSVAGGGDDPLVELRDLVFGVMAATRQVASAGTGVQIEAAQQILRDARKRLYRLLAED